MEINNLVVDIPANLKSKLHQISQSTHQSETSLTVEAIENFVELNEWQIKETKKGLAEVKRGNFASDNKVKAAFDKWKNI